MVYEIAFVQNNERLYSFRCDPNPCEHGGVCSQDYRQFHCDCTNTGYEGEVCHKSKYLVSCDEALDLNPLETALETTIDIDDSGPLDPFPVRCVFQRKCLIIYLHISSLSPILFPTASVT